MISTDPHFLAFVHDWLSKDEIELARLYSAVKRKEAQFELAKKRLEVMEQAKFSYNKLEGLQIAKDRKDIAEQELEETLYTFSCKAREVAEANRKKKRYYAK